MKASIAEFSGNISEANSGQEDPVSADARKLLRRTCLQAHQGLTYKTPIFRIIWFNDVHLVLLFDMAREA